MATAGLGDDALDVDGFEVALVAVATGPGQVLGVAEADRQLGEAGGPAGQEPDDCQGDDRGAGGDLRGWASVRTPQNTASVPIAEASAAATNGASPCGSSMISTTESSRTATQPTRNWSLPGPSPASWGMTPEPAMSACGSAEMPSATAEPRSS